MPSPPRSHENRSERREADATPRAAITLLVEVALLLGGLAVYLLVTDWNPDGSDGYAFVIAIHLALLAAGCLAVAVRLIAKRRSRAR